MTLMTTFNMMGLVIALALLALALLIEDDR
jgi:hypothetical protein